MTSWPEVTAVLEKIRKGQAPTAALYGVEGWKPTPGWERRSYFYRPNKDMMINRLYYVSGLVLPSRPTVALLNRVNQIRVLNRQHLHPTLGFPQQLFIHSTSLNDTGGEREAFLLFCVRKHARACPHARTRPRARACWVVVFAERPRASAFS